MIRGLFLSGLTITSLLACEHEAKVSLPAKAKAVNSLESVQKVEEKPEPKNLNLAANIPVNEASVANKIDVYRLTGQVSAPRKASIAFRVGGLISSIKARAGTSVKKGDILALLDSRDYTRGAEIAKAQMGQAKVAANSAALEYKREQQLRKENVSNEAVFDKVEAAYNQANQALRLAELNYESALAAVEDTKLRAPYDCVVAKLFKDENENVQLGMQSGSPVFMIYESATPEISLEAPEGLIGQLTVGKKLHILIPAIRYDGEAEIIRMVPVMSEQTRTFSVVAKPLNPNSKIVPGLYAEAIID